ncbi:Chemotaxis protein CheA [Anatilimnocola aggregata]|uniref:histidine kinase n=1 Tax=Anatilimnocola aggregata TaxID=2528021 RepID=A0A517YE58_9BACT|nr:chemotaxis protein CheW [Anatilimnocola aggregata]QDU28487.1 Chemotaxis protein CheA [Anatilimnocola aggregata]
MNAADNELIDIFIIESTESLADLDQRLLAIETAGEAADPELVNQLFRAVHSVKGVAGFLGFEKIIQVAHHLESALSLVRSRQLIINEDSIETLLAGGDLLRRLVQDARQSGNYDAQDMINALQRLNQSCKASAEQQLESAESGVAALQAEFTAVPGAIANPTAPRASNENLAATAAAPEASIRVPVPVLERLMNLAGELVLTRNQMLQVIGADRRRSLSGLGNRLDQVTSELHDAIMSARMQQVGTVLNRFPRLVRDLNRRLNKQCVLQIEGAEVELDRTILEAIGDPLTHLVRNSVDHGLEMPHERVAAGKSPEGALLLRAFHEAGKVHITLSDDGKGINVQRVREKAISRGLISAEQAASLSHREVVQLIFQPGFSTAETVTDVSGRGVGMDVVKTSIQRVGGTVEIESTPNQGTTVHISLPLTLAIIPSWIVTQSNFRFAIPESAIIELVRPQAGDSNLRVETYAGRLALRWRDSLLPLLRMNDVLPANMQQADKRTAGTPQNIVIVETGRRRFGLAVDSVEGPEQIVVKALGRHLRDFKMLAGAAVLGDGSIAYVLDIAGLGAQTNLKSGKDTSRAVTEVAGEEQELQTVLLIRNGAGKLLAVPRPMITRIERIDTTQIKTTGSLRTLTYRVGTLPIVEVVDAGQPQQSLNQNAYVLVFNSAGREAGLLAHELVDVCEASTNVDTTLFYGNGLMGSLTIDGELTRLIDVYELLDCQLQQAHSNCRAEKLADEPSGVVLLAEDSAFIRQQVGRVVKAAGYHVIMAENGLKAWELLQAQPELFDVVLTDIEMPVMNGYEFCTRIRGDERFAKLPVIALTSLNSDEQIHKGAEAGID